MLALPNLAEDYSPFINYICKIYGLLVIHEGEADRAHPDTVKNLLTLAQKPEVRDDTADFISLSAAASAYLASEALQKRIVEDAGQLSLLLDTVHHAHTGLQADDPEETESIGVLRGSLHKILSDVTALDEFGQHHALGTPAPDALLSWLRGTNTALRSAACLALGNLCRSDETSTALVAAPHEAHVPLIRFLSDPAVTDAPALHAAMSFLKNLAIPVANKPLLGPLLEQDCVPRIYALDTQPQVQFAAASLTRILLVNCPPNVQRACKKLDEGTVIASLCALFSRTDAEPTKMEAARAVATLCRVLHSNPVGSILPDWAEEASGEADADSRTRANFYSAHDNLATPLSFLVGQKKWPSLRSEAWFILALMCRSSDGSRLVGSVIADYEPVTAALVEAVTGRPASEAVPVAQEEQVPEVVGDPNVPKLELEPQQINTTQKAGLAKVDRENTVVMLQEILRHWGGELPAQRAALWRGLVQEGTQAIVKEREGK